MLNIRVPITKKPSSTLYTMKPLAALQKDNSSLYVKPSHTYILISSEGYYYFNTNDFQQCTEIERTLICKNEWFTYEQTESCEYTLLNKPESLHYQTCKLIYCKHPVNTILRSSSEDEWVY